jgi:hypothetical protein
MRLDIEERRLEREGPRDPHWWWLSFSTNEAFLGATIIEAHTFKDAYTLAWNRGIAPGKSKPSGLILDPGTLAMMGDEYRNRLLTKDDLTALEEREGKSLFATEQEIKRADMKPADKLVTIL